MRTLLLALPLIGCHSRTVVEDPPSSARDTGGGGETTEDIIPGDTSDDDTGDSGKDTGDPGPDDDALYAAFFDPTVIQEIHITLSEDAIRTLNYIDGRSYVEGSVVVNGEAFDAVGVRLKGSSTYQDLDCSDGYCKAAFKIKFNEFVVGQQYGSLERITLDNMTTDYTQSKEVIAYNLLVDHGQLASRANYARVTLNGEPWGLYANVESADDEWLQRRFTDATGDFWGTASYYGDFYTQYLDTGWVLKSGEGTSGVLEAVTAALDNQSGDFFGDLEGVLNTEQVLDYWAWCVAVGNYDGYPFTINDVLVYADPADGLRLAFAPWGTDESWDEYEWSGRTWNVVTSRIGYACLNDNACIQELRTRIAVAVDAYDAADVLARAEAAWDLSESDVQTDPVRPISLDSVMYYRNYYSGVIPEYGDYVRRHVGIK